MIGADRMHKGVAVRISFPVKGADPEKRLSGKESFSLDA